MNAALEAEFKRATLALAADAVIQISLFPPFVCFGDELVMDWYESRDLYLREECTSLPAAQKDAIQALDAQLRALGTSENERLFCEADALADTRWDPVRVLAKAVCSAFGWPLEPPTKSSVVYVPAERNP
jgi:hypothetical protein